MKQPSRPRAGQPEIIRPGVLPGILGSLSIVAGLFLFGSDWFITIQFAVSILAAIVATFAIQGRNVRPVISWIATVFLAAVVVVWNPIVNLTAQISAMLGAQGWMLAEIAGAAIVFTAGILIKTIAPSR
jgi:hypothetical protein